MNKEQEKIAIDLISAIKENDGLMTAKEILENPIGKSSRSNPVTYTKAYDEIRKLFSIQQSSKIMGYKPAHFSFNVDGGRCDECQGDGNIKIEMQFMADVHLECETCKGMRFKKEVLEVKFYNKSINDILNSTIDDAIAFFKMHQETKIVKKLQPLQDVGLGYVTLGQSSSTLSGGEAQRLKLAKELIKNTKKKSLVRSPSQMQSLDSHCQ